MLETIDELLIWLEKSSTQYGAGMDAGARKSIRAILEQHRPSNMTVAEQWWELREHKLAEYKERAGIEAIRAFVERVEKRLPEYSTGKGADSWLKEYRRAVYSELEAMEEVSTPSGQSSSVPSTD